MNEFTGARAPTVPYNSDVQVTVQHDFSETFERETYAGNVFGKGGWHNLVNRLCKLQYQKCLLIFLYYNFILHRW